MRALPVSAVATLPGLLAGLMACAPQTQGGATVAGSKGYLGVQTRILDSAILGVEVGMTGGATPEELDRYATCAAARYALAHDFGFVRHLRTTLHQKGGVRRADAVYTISPALPKGSRTIDAEVTVADCIEQGIPTV